MGWAILGIIVVAAIYVIFVYNGLVGLRQRVNQAFADIDVQLKQRHDLIPNLVETVKGYAAHEKSTLDAVIAARNAAQGAHGPAAQAPPSSSSPAPSAGSSPSARPIPTSRPAPISSSSRSISAMSRTSSPPPAASSTMR